VNTPDLVTVMTLRRGLANRAATLAIAATVSLIALCLVVMAVSYRHAVAQDQLVTRAHDRDQFAQRAEKYFWWEREAMNEFLLMPRPAVRREIKILGTQFERVLAELHGVSTEQQRREVEAAAEAHRLFVQEFRADRLAAGRSLRKTRLSKV